MNREQAIAAIKQGVDCRRFLTTSKSGLYCCPICGSGTGKNKTGAMKYYPETNTCACFAKCKPDAGHRAKSYDVLDLIQNEYSCDFNSALQVGADMLHITIDETAGSLNERAVAGAWMEKAKAMAAKATSTPKAAAADYTAYYEACRQRLEDPAAILYLSERGISTGTAAACGIGFDPVADPASAPGAMGDTYRPHPTPRIIIPTSKTHYVGRRTDGADEFKKLNAKDSTPAIFNKAALYAQDAQAVFVVEGAFDALSIIEVGAAAVALNSTKNVPVLLQDLEQHPTAATLIVCMDNDESGQSAITAIKEGLPRLHIPFITADINCGMNDPNEALTTDRNAFTAAVQAAVQAARSAGQTSAENAAESPQAATGDYLTDFLDKIQSEAYKPYKTGLTFFDDLLGGGLTRQQILLLMAAPGAGKTTLAQQIAESMAQNKKPVIYLNLEMSREQMLAKAISGRLARKRNGKIQMSTMQILQGYSWTPEQQAAVTAEIEEYRQDIFPYLKYNPAGTSSDLETIIKYLTEIGQQERGKGSEAPAVILDYLHLVKDGRLETQELLKQTMTALKNYAVEFNTCAIAISATNRTSNSSGQITMESGRDSSNLEYGSDVQLSLNYYEIETGKVKPTDAGEIARLQQETWRQMIIRVLKGRFVTPGRSAKVFFNAENNTFYGENDWMPVDPNRTPFLKEGKKAGKTR